MWCTPSSETRERGLRAVRVLKDSLSMPSGVSKVMMRSAACYQKDLREER